MAFDRALSGGARGVLVAGAAGVGKTALVHELRPLVMARKGWFVTGKFDQYQPDAPTATAQALRVLARLLLAEPEENLPRERLRILQAVGRDAAVLAALSPEWAVLLGPQPELAPVDAMHAEAKLRTAVVALLRATVSSERPLVMVQDDLQWAAAASVRMLDLLLSDDTLDGLVVVCTYRDAEIGATHPLFAKITQWKQLGLARKLRLENLRPPDLCALLADMLRLPAAQAVELASAVGERTAGNPFDTVELVNALRHEGVLVCGTDGWAWNAADIRRHVGQGDVVDLLSARIARLGPEARSVLEVIACLGGEVPMGLLRAASDPAGAAVDEQLAAPLEDGLIVFEPGSGGSVWFRHDRVQQAAHSGLTDAERIALNLVLARRLATASAYRYEAASQYLPTLAALDDVHECHHVVDLLREAAAQARRRADHIAVERLLAGAIDLMQRGPGRIDEALLGGLHIEWHAALFILARFEHADQVYELIEARWGDPIQLAEPAGLQVSSMTTRGRPRDGVAFGLAMLRRLGLDVPEEISRTELARRMEAFYRWAREDRQADDVARPEPTDPRIVSACNMLRQISTSAGLCDLKVRAWITLEGQRLWDEHGPCAALFGVVSAASALTIGLRADFRTGYDVGRRILALGAARGYEAATAAARARFAMSAAHWFESPETIIEHVRRARELLLRSGELQLAGFGYFTSVAALLDCGVTLDAFAQEVEAGLAFAARSGNRSAVSVLLPFAELLVALKGHDGGADLARNAAFAETAVENQLNSPGTVVCHVARGLAAALFGDMPAVQRHVASAKPHLAYFEPYNLSMCAQVLQALALAERIRTEPDQHDALLEEFEISHRWVTRRAAEAPANFQHLQQFVEAERAWAVGDLWAAQCAYEAALRLVEHRQRPWHRALISERAAMFNLSQGLDRIGRALLAEARSAYLGWGAAAKVRELEQHHPFLRSTPSRPDAQRSVDVTPSTSISVDSIDMLAVLRASQALSSQTSLGRLKASVVKLLGAMTGATQVELVWRRDDPAGWYVSADADEEQPPLTVEQAAARELVPLSVFRYVERTGQPLLLEDALRDDRFAQDRYLAGAAHCSMLAVPIHSQGVLRAVLFLENRLGRGAFSVDRLDAVTLVAGQLAVSLDNALLYASLEHKVGERTEALEAANGRLRQVERERIAVELHDTLLQGVYGLLLKVQSAVDRLPPSTDVYRDLKRAIDRTEALVNEGRDRVKGLRGPGGKFETLKAAIEFAIAEFDHENGACFEVAVRGRPMGLLPDVQDELYCIAREAMQNALDHSGAKLIRVDLVFSDSEFRMAIQDDGRGIEPQVSSGGPLRARWGVTGMHERAKRIGGVLHISTGGDGTTVEAVISGTAAYVG